MILNCVLISDALQKLSLRMVCNNTHTWTAEYTTAAKKVVTGQLLSMRLRQVPLDHLAGQRGLAEAERQWIGCLSELYLEPLPYVPKALPIGDGSWMQVKQTLGSIGRASHQGQEVLAVCEIQLHGEGPPYQMGNCVVQPIRSCRMSPLDWEVHA